MPHRIARPPRRPKTFLKPREPSDAFPVFQYASIYGSFVLVILFSSLYLPRSSAWLGVDFSQQIISQDRPQWKFLNPLTAKPLYTMGWLCLGIFSVILWWSSWVRQWYSIETKSRIEDSMTRVQAKMIGLRNASIATLVGTFAFYIVITFWGAPIIGHNDNTVALSFLLSILTVFTPAYALPAPSFDVLKDREISLHDSLTWKRLFSEIKTQSPTEQVILYPIVGSLVGAWLAVLPLALDWQRPWQSWPLLPAYGAIFGHIGGAGHALLSIFWNILVEEGKKVKSE